MPEMLAPSESSTDLAALPIACMDRVSTRGLLGLRGELAAILIFALLCAGCDRNIEPYKPGEEARPPDLARIFPAPPGGAGSADPAGRTSGPPDRSALPPSRAEGSKTDAADNISDNAVAPIAGVVDLAPELALARPDGGVLFVIARPQGVRGGPPLAVLRIPSPDFPLEFTIGPENVMIPSMRFAGAISLSARLDEDGNAMTRGAGDISSPVEESLSPGATGVRILLSERG